MTRKLVTIFLLVLALAACSAKKPSNTNPSLLFIKNGTTETWTLQTLQTKLKSVAVTVQNPVYQKQKTYEGFQLEEVLALVGFIKSTQIFVTALDGYVLNLDLQNLPLGHAYLAFREAGKSNTDWELIPKKNVSPAPFWLVWNTDKVHRALWPYQIAKIEIKDSK